MGKHFNHDRVPVIKGQSIAAYDPRAIQGMAVTYATTPMGGDHTAGWVVDQNLEDFGGTLDPFSAEGQVEASRNTQIHMAAVDSVGICDFAQSGLATPEGPGNVYAMIAAKSGKPFSENDWTELGLKVIKAELEFNRNAGFTNTFFRLMPSDASASHGMAEVAERARPSMSHLSLYVGIKATAAELGLDPDPAGVP